MTKQSDTPLTDAVRLSCQSLGSQYLSSSCHMALNHAERLERERAKLVEALRSLVHARRDGHYHGEWDNANELLQELGENA